ncbi:hypothetical protein Pmani_005314 [Petrolisthes manimaculis]|uniref:C-type lectin domain-containing protein n=1 Tax=Petrolisthes manimaculis TaxID=1843537 RepID=A0AAE1QF77_9EUCA|nr:hypothetical protein Pmani_005314 [Petrolisthes manimaculis]
MEYCSMSDPPCQGDLDQRICQVSWGEAGAFCETLGGELITFKNATHYAEVVTHLKEAQLTSDFWIGGRYPNESLGWSWIDDSPMQLGTPYWAVRHTGDCLTRNVTYPELGETREANAGECYNYVQAPRNYLQGRCVSITYNHYYYMSDEDCLSKRSPLCVLTETAGTYGIGGVGVGGGGVAQLSLP